MSSLALGASVLGHALFLGALLRTPPAPAPRSLASDVPVELEIFAPASAGQGRRTARAPELIATDRPVRAKAPSFSSRAVGSSLPPPPSRTADTAQAPSEPSTASAPPTATNDRPPLRLEAPAERPTRTEDGAGRSSAESGPATEKVGARITSNGLEAVIEHDGTLSYREPPVISSRALDKPLRVEAGVAPHLDPPTDLWRKTPKVTFDLDLTELVMRGRGIDRFYREKAKIADETREQRTAMAATLEDDRKREALLALTDQLKKLRQLEPEARRKRILEIWDDVGGGADDPLAQAARAVLRAWVRRNMRQGTPDGFTDVQLRSATIDQRARKTAIFDPYSTAGPP